MIFFINLVLILLIASHVNCELWTSFIYRTTAAVETQQEKYLLKVRDGGSMVKFRVVVNKDNNNATNVVLVSLLLTVCG